MPKLLRKLVIDDVSSVDRGAGRGVRVVLTKRDGAAESNDLDIAVAALDCSIQSTIDDSDVVNKMAAINESADQFKEYICSQLAKSAPVRLAPNDKAPPQRGNFSKVDQERDTLMHDSIAKMMDDFTPDALVTGFAKAVGAGTLTKAEIGDALRERAIAKRKEGETKEMAFDRLYCGGGTGQKSEDPTGAAVLKFMLRLPGPDHSMIKRHGDAQQLGAGSRATAHDADDEGDAADALEKLTVAHMQKNPGTSRQAARNAVLMTNEGGRLSGKLAKAERLAKAAGNTYDGVASHQFSDGTDKPSFPKVSVGPAARALEQMIQDHLKARPDHSRPEAFDFVLSTVEGTQAYQAERAERLNAA